MIVTSRSNAAVKHIRGLRSRKERDLSGLFFIEGIRLVAAAVEMGAQVDTCVIAAELLRSGYARELADGLQERGVPLLEVTAEIFRSLSIKEGPQGIGAVVRQRWHGLDGVDLSRDHLWVALDEVQDPGNLGTILRTLDAVGGAGVMLLGSTTDPYDPVALRASMGAIFSQRLVRVQLAEFDAWKRRTPCLLAGASDDASAAYRTVRYPPPTVLLMGSERQGLAVEQQALCDVMVHIPMVGHSDSLNLAVATGVILYEIFAQWH